MLSSTRWPHAVSENNISKSARIGNLTGPYRRGGVRVSAMSDYTKGRFLQWKFLSSNQRDLMTPKLVTIRGADMQSDLIFVLSWWLVTEKEGECLHGCFIVPH